MSGGGQDDGNSLHSAALGWGIMLCIFAALAFIIWYNFDAEIREIIRWIRYGQMWLIKPFIGLFELIGLIEEGEYTIQYKGRDLSWESGFKAIPEFNYKTMTNQHLGYMSALTMQPLTIPFAFMCALGVIWVIFRGPETYYRSKLDLDGLIARQSKNFPVISPFINFNPSNQPPRPPGAPVPAKLPAFAEALSAEEWVAYNRIPVPDGQIDEARAERALMKQLGGRWKGWKALKPYKQVLLAGFTLRSIRKRDESDELLGRMATCWTHKKGLKIDRKLLSDARKILNDKKKSEGILKICNQHAFETTALLGALNFTREEGGVLASAQFVWLRAHDRTLWYPLNNLGRQSLHMEALGAMSHYMREKRTKRPIPVPKIEDAIQTLREYFSSKKARPIPALDYQGSGKKSIKKAV